MSAAFHRGVTQALRRKLQTAGIRVEEQDAQKILAGATVVNASAPAKETFTTISKDVWFDRFGLMRDWESEHSGEDPFPPIFAQVVLEKLQQACIHGTTEEVVLELIQLAEAELEL